MMRAYSMATKNGIPTEPEAFYKGEPIFILKSILGMVHKEMRIAANYGHQQTHVVIVFDHPGKNFRHELYPEYKANRPEKDYEYTRQVELAYEMFQTQGFYCIQHAGVEADDVIGTLTSKLSKRGIKSIIYGGDKDTLSQVDQNTFQYAGRAEVLYDEAKVRAKFGIEPSRIIDFLTLQGDTSDNVPGVPGIGEKTATALLQNHSLKQLIKNPQLVAESGVRGAARFAEYFKENTKQIELSRKLVDLDRDIKLNVNLSDFIRRQPEQGDFLELIL